MHGVGYGGVEDEEVICPDALAKTPVLNGIDTVPDPVGPVVNVPFDSGNGAGLVTPPIALEDEETPELEGIE